MSKAKNTILISLIIILLGYGFSTFATDGSTVEQNLADKMDTFVKILSWVWIPIANLAGKFMTNSFVTGEVLKIADFLFQAWSLSRTVVNFVIVGVVLTIIWDIIQKGSSKDLGTKITKLIITTIAVNLSWFAISAMVDLGTLALLGVSNMGTSIIDSLPVKKSMLEQIACPPKEIIIDFDGKSNTLTPSCTSNGTDGLSINDIVPTTDSMSGPLRYFGIGVFHIFDFLSSDGNSHEIKTITIGLMVKLFLMIMFITPIIALLVVNFARIFMIWMWFMFAPFIALKRGMSGSGVGRLDSMLRFGNGGGEDYFDIKNIIGAIFAPAVVAATLFLAVITVASLFGALTRGVNNDTNIAALSGAATAFWNDIDGGVISVDNSSITIPGGGKMTFDGNIYEDTSKQIMGSFGYIIICVMTMGLLWAVFRVGLSSSSLLSSYGKKVMDAGKKTITTGLKLPIGVDGKSLSLDQIGEKFSFKGMEGIARGNMITQNQRSQFDVAEQTKSNILGKLGYDYDINRGGSAPFDEKKFGITEADLDANLVDKTKLLTFEAESQKYFKAIMDNMAGRKTTIKGDSPQFRNALSSWITSGGYDYMVSKKIVKKDEEKHFLDVDGKKTFSIDKFWSDVDANQATGAFVKKIFSKDFYDNTNKSPLTIFANYTKEVGKVPINPKYKIKYSDFTG